MFAGSFCAILICTFWAVAMSANDFQVQHPLLKKIARAAQLAGITDEEAAPHFEEHSSHLRAVHVETQGNGTGGNGTHPRFFPGVLRLTFYDGSDANCSISTLTHAELFQLNTCFNTGNGSVRFRAWKTSNNHLGFTTDHFSAPHCSGHYSKKDNYFPYQECYGSSIDVEIEDAMPLAPPPGVGAVAVVSGFKDQKTCENSFNLPWGAGHVQIAKIGACLQGDSSPDQKVVDCNGGIHINTYPSSDGSCTGNSTASTYNENSDCISQDIDGSNISPLKQTHICLSF